ncbi:hypothetical protein ACFSKL_02610 [Belliella marina]|uniref:Dihydrolipoamide dehydrogenase n=1 Tax=Belliella marina TaxID=1644146 RepID=A0ABW4VG96_9BACT
MKNLIKGVLIMGLMAFFACEGPPGPAGPPGLDGVEYSSVYERTVSFNANNGYIQEFNFPNPIYEDDVVLIYIEWERTNQGLPIWRLLPQSVFFEEGILQYNYDFTQDDYSIFLDTTFDPSILDSSWLLNQKFRIVVVPGLFANARIDYNNYEGVMEMIGMTEEGVVKL